MEKRIRILATSDVHAAIFPYRYADRQPSDIGFARLNTLINSLRDENTILLDNGDTIEGSPLSIFHNTRHPDDISPVTAVMHEMHYDYINVGNHDFDYGQEPLMMHLQNVGAPCITANFYYYKKPYGPTYVIREIAGVKIALIGVVTQYIPHWESKEHLKNIHFRDAFKTLKKNVELVKSLEKPDFIIAMYHGGFERDIRNGWLLEEDTGENEGCRMLQEIPDLDILIAGHQHQSKCGFMNRTAYTETRDKGREIACIDIYPDTGKIKPQLISITSLPADESLLKVVQHEEDQCQSWLDEVLGTTDIDLKIRDENEARLHKSQLITFINQVQMETTSADISSAALYPGAVGFDHEITMRSLVSTYTYTNSLVVKKINGRILKDYLEKSASYWIVDNGLVEPDPDGKPYNYDMLDGIEYTINVSNPVGQRITTLKRDGKDILPDDEMTICVNNYRGAGGGDFDMLKNAPTVSFCHTNMIELLADYITVHKRIHFDPVHNIKITA